MNKQNHCPEESCAWYSEEHCYYWQGGKCKFTKDFLLITQPIWDKDFAGEKE